MSEAGMIIVFWLLVFLIFVFPHLIETPEPDEIEVHPKLEGKDLDQWLKLYEGISIQYQRSLYTPYGVAELTWEQWGKLTGKEIWETIPNPEKITEEIT